MRVDELRQGMLIKHHVAAFGQTHYGVVRAVAKGSTKVGVMIRWDGGTTAHLLPLDGTIPMEEVTGSWA